MHSTCYNAGWKDQEARDAVVSNNYKVVAVNFIPFICIIWRFPCVWCLASAYLIVTCSFFGHSNNQFLPDLLVDLDCVLHILTFICILGNLIRLFCDYYVRNLVSG